MSSASSSSNNFTTPQKASPVLEVPEPATEGSSKMRSNSNGNFEQQEEDDGFQIIVEPQIGSSSSTSAAAAAALNNRMSVTSSSGVSHNNSNAGHDNALASTNDAIRNLSITDPSTPEKNNTMPTSSTTGNVNNNQKEQEEWEQLEQEQEKIETPEDLNAFVSDLLDSMQTKFQHMGKTLISRIDEMGDRIDDLESSIGELMDHQGLSDQNTMPTSSRHNGIKLGHHHKADLTTKF